MKLATNIGNMVLIPHRHIGTDLYFWRIYDHFTGMGQSSSWRRDALIQSFAFLVVHHFPDLYYEHLEKYLTFSQENT